MLLHSIHLYKGQQQSLFQQEFLATFHGISLPNTYTEIYFTLVRWDILTRIALIAQKYFHAAIRFVQESKLAARIAPLSCSTFIFLFYIPVTSLYLLPFKKAGSSFLFAAHRADPKDLPKQPRGFNYLINLKEEIHNVTVFILLSEDLRNASSNTENLFLPVQFRQQVWHEIREAEKVSQSFWDKQDGIFTKIIFSLKLNDKGKG